MAEILINHAFRFATFTLNYLSPSIIADLILHPFDFATVLLQISFDPKGLKSEKTTFVTALAQYALLTFYIPYLFTSVQGIQFMGLPHPSMFYFVTYIYNKEGIFGCYRGILPKICERIVMMYVNETVKQFLSGVAPGQRSLTETEEQDEKFGLSLINGLCSQFFAVLASHPFHVIMISSFAEFTYQKKSSMYTLAQSIYDKDGFYGFFIGLSPRLVGEMISLTFSLVYTELMNKQIRAPEARDVVQPATTSAPVPSMITYFSEASRFGAFKSNVKDVGMRKSNSNNPPTTGKAAQYFDLFNNILGNLAHNQPNREVQTDAVPLRSQFSNSQNRGIRFVLAYLPLTSKQFYYMMLRDYISKKLSYPFFLVSHCMIVLDTGWDKLPVLQYLCPLIRLISFLNPGKRDRSKTHK